jgi:hypothetical protein
MFIAEAIPTVLVGIFLLFCVTDRPQLARWLSDEERSWLISTLETERRLVEAKRKISFWQSFWNPKVLWLTLNYFGIVTGMAATPKPALIRSTFSTPTATAGRSALSARIPITVGSSAAARRSRCRDYSACPCLPACSGAANTDSRASAAPTCPSRFK